MGGRTHRGCAGTRGEGRWGRASTHTGLARSRSRCPTEERWPLRSERMGGGRNQKRSQLLCIITCSGRLSSRVLPPPNGAINPAFHFCCFHVSPVVVTGTVVVSGSVGSVGVTVSAGVLVSAHQKKKTADRRGGGVKGGGVRQSLNCKEHLSVTPLFVLEIVFELSLCDMRGGARKNIQYMRGRDKKHRQIRFDSRGEERRPLADRYSKHSVRFK